MLRMTNKIKQGKYRENLDHYPKDIGGEKGISLKIRNKYEEVVNASIQVDRTDSDNGLSEYSDFNKDPVG